MYIACYFVVDGRFEAAHISEQLCAELIKNLRANGTETVHFANRSIEVEGIYIPAKGSTTKMMLLPDEE